MGFFLLWHVGSIPLTKDQIRGLLALGVWSLSHWTIREVSALNFRIANHKIKSS